MYPLYSLILTVAFLALLPYFAYHALMSRKYIAGFWQRMGWLPRSLESGGQPTIWLHAVSVGEALAALPIAEAIRFRFPDHRLIVSTTTTTGQSVAQSRIRCADGFFYFPFDWKFAAARALHIIKPGIVVLMESELWPRFVRLCSESSIPIVVANGRISDRSFRRTRRIGFFMRGVYSDVSHFAMQSEASAERAVLLGAHRDRVSVCGNTKYDIDANHPSDAAGMLALGRALGLEDSTLIIAGSTTDGEEELVLDAFRQLRILRPDRKARLLLAPRHPERFDQVVQQIERSGFTCIRRSAINAGRHRVEPSKAEVILLDSVGELATLFRFATAVFIGGSLVPRGGHNILEPAIYGKPIIVGPYTSNFEEITREFLGRDALVQLNRVEPRQLAADLTEELRIILDDENRAKALGDNALAALNSKRGASNRVVSILGELMLSRTQRL